MNAPKHHIAAFGDPKPPEKDAIESGIYHPDMRFAPFRTEPGDLLLLYCIGRLAFTTRVPRTEDVGHDLLCSMIEKVGGLLKAGPFFTVQIKGGVSP